ncbi:MAG TPA: hypothetical protein HPP81_01080 [Deltaproteobacteria bacterium]|nr:hypothetical protein [Deltaproteobacteria bacterium]
MTPIGFFALLWGFQSFCITFPGVGFTPVMSMLILSLIPSILIDMAKSIFSAVKDYPWFFIGASTFV